MSVRLKRKLFDVKDYNRMIEAGILTDKDKVELINGNLIEMSPIESHYAALVNSISNLMV